GFWFFGDTNEPEFGPVPELAPKRSIGGGAGFDPKNPPPVPVFPADRDRMVGKHPLQRKPPPRELSVRLIKKSFEVKSTVLERAFDLEARRQERRHEGIGKISIVKKLRQIGLRAQIHQGKPMSFLGQSVKKPGAVGLERRQKPLGLDAHRR